uniref:Uncharacterized protein n=1 Tax=Sciurus vulgaris TaxID=55149 RepID=A0A8D2DYC0_SCIVU
MGHSGNAGWGAPSAQGGGREPLRWPWRDGEGFHCFAEVACVGGPWPPGQPWTWHLPTHLPAPHSTCQPA